MIESIRACPNIHTQIDLINSLTDRDFAFLVRCIKTLIYNGFQFNRSDLNTIRKLLRPHQKQLKKFVSPRLSLAKKREYYNQEGGGLLMSALISGLIPVISSVIKKIVGKS